MRTVIAISIGGGRGNLLWLALKLIVTKLRQIATLSCTALAMTSMHWR
jgi:hypothetical protein